jgi:hypothetical protein
MENTKKPKTLSCRCGGTKVPDKVLYKEILLNGFVCNQCGNGVFTMQQFKKALELRDEYEQKTAKEYKSESLLA